MTTIGNPARAQVERMKRKLQHGKQTDTNRLRGQKFRETGRRTGFLRVEDRRGFPSLRTAKGFEIVLDALPVSGRVVLRLNEPKPKKAD